LVRFGVVEIEAEGKPFDPQVHEAVRRVSSNEHAPGTVVEVYQKGYLLKDRLLRPAMVAVAGDPG
jgi:molecular chaperone GrpE